MHGLNLLLVCLVMGLLVGRRKKTTGLSHDLFISIVLGVLLSICATWIYAPRHLDFPFYESDFVDYCMNLKTWDSSSFDSPKRSRLAASLSIN